MCQWPCLYYIKLYSLCLHLFAVDLDDWGCDNQDYSVFLELNCVRKIVCLCLLLHILSNRKGQAFECNLDRTKHTKLPKPASNAKPKNQSVCYTCCAQKTLKYWFVDWIVLLYTVLYPCSQSRHAVATRFSSMEHCQTSVNLKTKTVKVNSCNQLRLFAVCILNEFFTLRPLGPSYLKLDSDTYIFPP